MKKVFLVLMVVVSMAFIGCNKEKKTVDPYVPPINPVKGLFILNEGTFTYANASLSYYDMEANTIENNIFFRVNDIPIGDVGQSLTKIGNDLYIVVNNSNYIYKVDANTIQYKAKITGFSSPRYMLPINDSIAYVSDIESTGLYVLNLNTLASGFIETGNATEVMVRVGDEVFVSNYAKYYVGASDHTVQIVDCVNNQYVTEIEVGHWPNDMVVDKNNHIWVLCSGGFPSTDPSLICIDPATRSIIKRFDFQPEVDSPDGMSIDGAGENIYFLNGPYNSMSVYKLNINDEQLPDTVFIASEGRQFYNVKIHPQNGDVFVTEAKTTSNGNLWHYKSDGTLVGTFGLGMFPSYMLFN